MLERISFQLANNRGRYTHFVHDDGTVASLYPLETICEARVGLICEKEFPSEAQYDAAEELASFAVGIDTERVGLCRVAVTKRSHAIR
ncbi:hypothetical protein [Tardiphaga sp. 839_C3_N1_4]|uniref:hypothetical protein n=1 Tax=Tardiphaga sp. 839_C3_N1_4 TaxID=3240761 RepID=UPI003F2182B1